MTLIFNPQGIINKIEIGEGIDTITLSPSLSLIERVKEANRVGARDPKSVMITLERTTKKRPDFSFSVYKHSSGKSKCLVSCINARATLYDIPSPVPPYHETYNTVLKYTSIPSIIIYVPDGMENLEKIIQEGVRDYFEI
jgi:hypothetical protein